MSTAGFPDRGHRPFGHTLLSRAAALLACLLVSTATVQAGYGKYVDRLNADAAPVYGPSLIQATVSRVIDGNTLDAQVGGVRTPVGYLGVETPSLRQPCGMEAYDRNRELVAGGILLEPDPAYELDGLSRRLYYAYTADGTSIDETLVAEGLGRAVRTDGSHGAVLAALEAEAQAAGRGCLWADSAAS